MNLQLENKTALVTGSSQGIGFAIAEALGREGATVAINSNKRELVDPAIERLSKVVPGIRAIAAVADLTDAGSTEDLLRKVPAVDILVNSVGFYVAKEFQEISDQDWDEMMNLNFMSGVRLSRAYLPGMKERNWGRIIFISSESGEALDGPEVAAILSDVTGRDIKCDIQGADDFKALFQSSHIQVESWYAEGGVEFMRQVIDGRMGNISSVRDDVPYILGRPALTVRVWASQHRDELIAAAKRGSRH